MNDELPAWLSYPNRDEILTCSHCGKEFKIFGARGTIPKFCSGACKQSAYRKRKPVTPKEPKQEPGYQEVTSLPERPLNKTRNKILLCPKCREPGYFSEYDLARFGQRRCNCGFVAFANWWLKPDEVQILPGAGM